MADAIGEWLDGMGLGKHRPAFAENDVDFDVLPELEDADLRELGLSLGDRKRLLRAIRERAGPGGPPWAPGPVAAAPRHLSERILRSRAALEGERKQVTVLFADIKGSTELIADMDPDAAAGVLRAAVDEMMAAVHQYEGTVNKVLGDGIMAIFGAPIAHEDHAIRACYAALAMQARLARLAPRIRHEHGVDPRVRQGMNSGDVVVRAINNDLTMDYDAIGSTVHLAARMEQIAVPGTCRLTLDTFRLAEGYIEVDALGGVPVKGVDGPVEMFELKGAIDIRSRFLARQRGRLTRFVGRDDEIRTLERAWHAASRGEGQCFSVMGEAGVGKSRLYYEFVHGPVLRDVLVLESGSVSHARAAAFHPLIDLLRIYFGVVGGDDERRIRERVIGKLLALDEQLRAISAPLLTLLGAQPDDNAFAGLDPAQRRRLTLDACRTLLLREADVQPMVVIFEDLHWVDAETLAFLDLLVGGVGHSRLLLLFNYRPEFADPWIGRNRYGHVRIDPLPEASSDELLADLLGTGEGLEGLRRVLMERTEGYPFYIEETVQGLVEEDVLEGERGTYRLTVPVDRIRVPPSVQSVIAARIDRLPPEGKQLLQAASVVGKDFELTLLAEVGELDEADLQDQLVVLQSGEFIYETRLFPDPEYTFKHALTHQVAYESLLRDRRRQKHTEILAAMERLFDGRLEERLERLVYHGVAGEDWEKVHRHAMAAGHRAMAMNANRGAVEAFDHVAEALGHLPRSPENLRDAVDCRFELRDALFVLGEPARILALMEEARELAGELDDRRRLVEVLLYQSGSHWAFARNRPAMALAREALSLAEAADDDELSGVAHYRIASAALMMGDYRTAADSGLAGAELLRPVAGDLMRFGGLVQTFVGSFGAVALAELGRFDEAVTLGRAAFDTALAAKHAYSISVSCFGIGHALALRGDFEDAIRPLEEGLRQIEIHSVAAAMPWVAGRVAYVYARLGRLEDMAAAMDMALDPGASEFAPSMMHAFAFVWLARAALVAGRVDEARELAANARSQGGTAEPDEGVLAWAEWALVECARREGGQGAEVAGPLDGVSRAAEARGMRPLRAHVLATRAALGAKPPIAAEALELANALGMTPLAEEIRDLGL